jgi:uncharacterized protein (DUF58 family)
MPPLDLLARLHYLALVSRRMGGSPLLAAPRKKLPGGGTELTGYRDYAPGDDWRQIHWTWCARRDELLVKLFEGDADRHVYLLVDGSASMGFGRPAKIELARRIAAALGYAALADLQRLGAAVFAQGLVADLPPLRQVARFGRLLEFLDAVRPGGTQTDLARSAAAFIRRFPRPGPLVVLSDLYDPGGFTRGLDLLRHAGYEPRLVHLVDPEDARTDISGDLELADAESQAVRETTVTERAARRYCALVADFHDRVAQYCRRHGMAWMRFACDAAEEDVLLRVLGARRAPPLAASQGAIPATPGTVRSMVGGFAGKKNTARRTGVTP